MALTFNATQTGTAAVLNIPAGNVVGCVAFSYSAAPTGGRLTINDGVQTRLDVDITAGGQGFIPTGRIQAAGTNTLTITLASGGGAIVGKLNWL